MNLSMLNCLNECFEDDECRQFLIERLKSELKKWIDERINYCTDPLFSYDRKND